MGVEILILIGTLGGATIGIIGQIIGNLINHKTKIKYMEKEIAYKKKFEYFEKINQTLEKETKGYNEIARDAILNKKINLKKLLSQLEYKRKKDERDMKTYWFSFFKEENNLKELRKYLDLQNTFYILLKRLSKKGGNSGELWRINKKIIFQKNSVIKEIKKEMKF